MTRRRVGDLMLLDCAASPFMGQRSPSVIDSPPTASHGEVLGFQFINRGVELVREGERELALRSGDMVLWDGMQPTEIEIVEPFHKRTLLFPRERVLAVCPRLRAQDTLPSLQGSPSARLLVRYMNALALEQPQLDEAASAAAATAALELLRAAVEPSLPPSRTSARTAARADVTRYVRAHLQDPELGPVSIARACAISVRTLHSLFEDVDLSVAGLVRSERLARCLEDLRQPNSGSVTDIAFRWGFCDAAHFSRAFKREFDATPSEIRQSALATGAAIARANGGRPPAPPSRRCAGSRRHRARGRRSAGPSPPAAGARPAPAARRGRRPPPARTPACSSSIRPLRSMISR